MPRIAVVADTKNQIKTGTASGQRRHSGAPRLRLAPDARREQIVLEAIAFFTEVGFGGTTRDLTKRLGVTQPLLYKYFASKSDLIDAVYERVFLGRLQPHWSSLVTDRSRPVRARMTDFYLEYADAILTREWVRIFMFAGLASEDLTRRYIERLGRTIIMPLRREICHEIKARHGAEAPFPTHDTMWLHHGGIFYIGIREHAYGLKAPKDRAAEVRASVARFLAAYGV